MTQHYSYYLKCTGTCKKNNDVAEQKQKLNTHLSQEQLSIAVLVVQEMKGVEHKPINNITSVMIKLINSRKSAARLENG